MHTSVVLPHLMRYNVTFWSRRVFEGAGSESRRIFRSHPPGGGYRGGEVVGDEGDFTKLTYTHV